MLRYALGVVVIMIAMPVAAGETVRLFNGKDLTGWEGAPGWWRVEDGALTCESTEKKPCKRCHYLFWKGGQPADFELSVDFRISKNANSGIQFRSTQLPNHGIYGYQADMSGNGGIVGVLYYQKARVHEFVARRGQKATYAAVGEREPGKRHANLEPDGKRELETLGDPKELIKGFRVEDWNTYRIVCRGPEITLYLNGVLMSQAIDRFPPRAVAKGAIALQMHPGHGPVKIQFKNIVLKELGQESSHEPSRNRE